MKHKIITGLFAAGLLAASATASANGTPVPDVVEPGVEITGAVDVITGWQHDDMDATATAGSIGGINDFTGGVGSAGGNTTDADHFRFVVNQVEVDLAKSFGENIRLRADIDFTDLTDTGAAAIFLEQAYVTANLAAGNGIEFLIGAFNAPVGVESVDVRDNWLISYAPPFRYMTPATVIGAKLYYAFSDLIDLHWAVVNDLNRNGFGDSAIPGTLFRLGFNWGDEGNESTLGISGGLSPESDGGVAGGVSQNKHFDFYGDLDTLIAVSDTVTIAAEGVYRQSNSVAAVGGANQKAIAGLLGLNYEVSDVWDVSFRAGYLWEINMPNGRGGSGASTTGGTWTGSTRDGTLYSGTVGAGYMITDGAKLKLEYRFDWYNTAGAGGNNDAQSLLAEFAYTF